MIDAQELTRRRAICETCPDFRRKEQGGRVVGRWCGRECHRPDGAYCEPWAQSEYGKRLLAEAEACKEWEDTELARRYRELRSCPSDINQHLPKLRELASQASTVVELGTRNGVSTTALLSGRPKAVRSYDIQPCPIAEELKAISGATWFEFIQGNSLEIDIPVCELLFIDTLHTEQQLAAELDRHARKAKRIVMHDTVSFGERGEDGGRGLSHALGRFLEQNPIWHVSYDSTENNGLTVIERSPSGTAEVVRDRFLAYRESWHTAEAMQNRTTQRESAPAVPAPFQAFYHVACMHQWKRVYVEQMGMMASLGITPIIGVLGSPEDVEWVRAQGGNVAYSSQDLHEYERPTLRLLYDWCRQNPAGAVLYLHTKGVSMDNDPGKEAWRRVMEAWVVRDWRRNLRELARHDAIGVDWQDSPTMPHFSGNFWMARADWINHLPSPDDHQASSDIRILGHPWARMHAEMWLGSRPYHVIESRGCRNKNLWSGNEVYGVLAQADREFPR